MSHEIQNIIVIPNSRIGLSNDHRISLNVNIIRDGLSFFKQ